MTRRSLFRTAAAAFAGSLLARLPLAGALPASADLPRVRGFRPHWILMDDPDEPCPPITTEPELTTVTHLGPVEIVLGPAQ